MIKLIYFFLIATLIGCGSGSAKTSNTTSRLSSPPTGCYDPRDYGAIPDDGISDQAALQQAVDAAPSGSTVCIGPGHYTCAVPPTTAYNRYACIATHGQNIDIRGTGPGTVIEVVGPVASTTFYVMAVDPSAKNITIADLAIDTTAATGAGEQFHGIQIGTSVCAGPTCAPMERIRLENLTFRHPHPGTERKGDCVRILGNLPTTPVTGVTVIGGTFYDCARSSIAIQRNVTGLIVVGNYFRRVVDQHIDFEPSGTGIVNESNIFSDNIFDDDLTITQGDAAVAVGGSPAQEVIITGNDFRHRGVSFYRARRIVMSNNIVTVDAKTGYGAVDVTNVMEDAVFNGNVITRRGVAGPVVKMIHANGSVTKSTIVSNNVLVQETAGAGIAVESASSMSITDNLLRWTVAAASSTGISLRATVADVDGFAVNDNHMVAVSLGWAVSLYADARAITRAVITNNTATNAIAGLRCLPGTGSIAPLVRSGNLLGPSQCTIANAVTN